MQKQRTILGIDPGTNILGFGVIRIDKNGPAFEDMGVLDLRKEKTPYAKLLRIFDEISVICDKYRPDDIALESPFYANRNAQVLFKLGRAQGAAILAAQTKGIEVFEYAPRKAKMAITGKGAASKEQVETMIKNILNIKAETDFLDATDALAIALCHYYQLTNPLQSTIAATSWEKFLIANPDRIKK